MSNKQIRNVEVNVGPQINCADTVESIVINDSTTCICNCSKVSREKLTQCKNPFLGNFRSSSLFVLLSVSVSEPSWTFSSANVPVAVVARLQLEIF